MLVEKNDKVYIACLLLKAGDAYFSRAPDHTSLWGPYLCIKYVGILNA